MFRKIKQFFNDFTSQMTSSKISKSPKRGITILLTILFALGLYIFMFPPLNLHSRDTWIFVLIIFTFFNIIAGKKFPYIKIRFMVLIGLVILFGVLNLTSIELFTAKKYANVIKIQDGDFAEDIKELPIDKIPTLDRDSSEKVGSRKMGELLDLVSQFNIDNMYTQINYKDRPVRVTPLEYNGLLKYLFNFSKGLPGYMTIDIVNGQTDLVQLEEGIKYSKDDLLFRNIYLYTRLKYPFEIFNNMEFEIDEQGVPYWIIPTYKNTVGFFGALDVKNVITVNAVTGETARYPVEEVPTWIDRVYNADRVIRQLDWYGKYQLGYFNSIFAQKQVLQTTEGYNYLALDDDIYMYTGFTSVAGDESNVGFILSNLRTKETKFYPISSAKEVSAMESAQGAVQEKRYKSTFPLLLNIKQKPTYFLSLKDDAGLIKQYAFVDAQDYQKVSVGNTVEEAYERHTGTIIEDDGFDDTTQFEELNGVIDSIENVVINGNTHYYFTLEGREDIFVSSIQLSEKLPFLRAGDTVQFKYAKTSINKVISFGDTQ